MISLGMADLVILTSLSIYLGVYFFVSRREGSYVNLLTPTTLLSTPAFFLLPLLYVHLFRPEGTPFAYIYVYATIAVESIVFAFFFCRRTTALIRLPFAFSYSHFWGWSIACLILASLAYLPILLKFPQYILNPRQIYIETRTGFGASSFTSTTLAYMAVILVLFTSKSLTRKAWVIGGAVILLSLHGSKGQVLEVLFFVLLYLVYVKRKSFNLIPTLIGAACVSGLIILLFAASMILGDSPLEALETVSNYSDYTRNDLLVIDSHFPMQYGRLTLEANTISLIPRILMPSKPKNFGTFYLAEEFFPEKYDADMGAPAFAIGVEYADFGWFSVVYLSLLAALRGWLARISVNRLRATRHPADLIIVAFLADITLFPIGGGGWFFPETVGIALLVRYISCFRADKICRERVVTKLPGILPHAGPSLNSAGESC